MRVGIIALLQESNTFLDADTGIEQFRQDLLLTGDAIRELEPAHHEIGGFLEGLKREQIDPVPLFAARATPFGTVTTEAFAQLVETLLGELRRAGRLDGLLLAPHGATVARSAPDADGHWLTRVREVAGASMPLIGTLDPHANLSAQMVDATNALTAYRTNPHLDQRERGVEAATLMARTLRREVRPTQAAAFPPMAINIEAQHTTEFPCADVLRHAEEIRSRKGVLSASLLLGFPYADVAEMGSTALVVTDNDPQLARRYANELAQHMWDLRRELSGTLIGVDDAMKRLESLDGPVCLLDMGDNVGGGSPGDGTALAHALHRRRVAHSFVCLCDPGSVAAADAAGVGSRLVLRMGSKLDQRQGPPLEAEVRVVRIADGVFREREPRHGGIAKFDQGRTAIVETAEGLTLMLTSRRVAPFSLHQLTDFGVDPSRLRAIVAKGVHAPVAAYRPVCRHLLRVNTSGVTTAEMTSLEYHHRRRPMYPFEPETCWTPE